MTPCYLLIHKSGGENCVVGSEEAVDGKNGREVNDGAVEV